MTKLQRILVVLVAAQIIVAALVLWPRPNASAGTKQLLGDLKADDVATLVLTDNQGTTIRLAKQSDAWILPDAGDFPADADKITPVLTKLIGLTVGQAVAQTSSSYKQLGVATDSFQRKVELSTAAGAGKTLFIGTSAGVQSSHVRLDGQNEVYLASDLTSWELNVDPASWIDTAYVKLNAGDVQSFSLANGNGQLSFIHDADGAWTLEGLAAGEEADADKISSLLSQALGLNITRPLGKTESSAYGLAQPSALLTLKVKSGDTQKTYTLTVGAMDEADSSYAVKLSESPYYVRVANYAAQGLVDAKREGYLKAVPTPTATAPRAAATMEP